MTIVRRLRLRDAIKAHLYFAATLRGIATVPRVSHNTRSPGPSKFSTLKDLTNFLKVSKCVGYMTDHWPVWLDWPDWQSLLASLA